MSDVDNGTWSSRWYVAKERIKVLETAIELVIQWNENTLGCSLSVSEVNEYLKDVLEGKEDEQ